MNDTKLCMIILWGFVPDYCQKLKFYDMSELIKFDELILKLDLDLESEWKGSTIIITIH